MDGRAKVIITSQFLFAIALGYIDFVSVGNGYI